MADNFLKTPLWQSILQLIDRKIKSAFNKYPQCMPVVVDSVDKNFIIANFQVSNGVYTIPTMRMPIAYSKYACYPVQKGDKGYAVPANYYMGGISGDDGGVANFRSRGNLSTHVFHPVSQESYPSRNYNQYTITGGPAGVMIRSADNKTYVEITSTGNLIVSPGPNQFVFLGGDPAVTSDKFDFVMTKSGPSTTVKARFA